jgi:serine/threonine protein kinase
MEKSRRRFSVGHCIGRGGFSTVYVATMISPNGLQTPVALKLLRRDRRLNDGAVRRLRDEGRILARLNHPTILKVFDLVTLDGRLTLVTEYVEGADLNKSWQQNPPPGQRALLQITSAVAGALDTAHCSLGDKGQPLELVHRDVKPRNIRLGRHGEVKLLDFGIATVKAMDREASTASDVVMGSLPYMAPERFVSQQTKAPSDLFSLGCSLYEGLAGAPFFTSSHIRTLSSMALEPSKYQRYLDERLHLVPHPGLNALLQDLLQFEAQRRPTAKELIQRCDELAEQCSGQTLGLWCHEQPWNDEENLGGTLEDTTLEDTLPEGDNRQSSHAKWKDTSGRPTIVHQAEETAALPIVKDGVMPHTITKGDTSAASTTPPIARIGLLAIAILVAIGLILTLLVALLGPTFFA